MRNRLLVVASCMGVFVGFAPLNPITAGSAEISKHAGLVALPPGYRRGRDRVIALQRRLMTGNRLAAEDARPARSLSSSLAWCVGLPLLGLLLVTGAAAILQSRLKKRARAVANAIEAASRGEPIPEAGKGDEFAPILEAAARIVRSLQSESTKASAGARRFEVLAQSVDVGLLQFQPGGGIEFANDRALAIFGCKDTGEIAGRLREHRPGLEASFRGLDARDASPGTFDLDVDDAGRSRAVRLELHMVGDPERSAVLALVKDLDAERALETELRLAAHLRGLSRVNASIAHDIRGPLNAIVLNLELLGGTLAGVPDPALRERHQRYIGVLRQEVRRLRDMVETVVGQIRFSADSAEPFDMRGVVQDLEALLDSYCRRHHVRMQISLPEVAVPIDGSRDALKQAMFNILIQSLDAMPGGGELQLSLVSDEREAILAIADTGSGVSRESSDAPGKLHPAAAVSGNGTGFQMARSVVDAHHGRIRVQSVAGSGTRLEIEIPLSTLRT